MTSQRFQSMEKASRAIASGSGTGETYSWRRWFSFVANKSTCGRPHRLTIHSNESRSSIHSVFTGDERDRASASTLRTPAIWKAERKSFFLLSRTRMDRTQEFRGLDRADPRRFRQLTTVELSEWTDTWVPLGILNFRRARYTAMSSRRLM